MFFGNPTGDVYAGTAGGDTDLRLYDRAEASAVRALAGEVPIGGRLPIELPGVAERGCGIDQDTVAHGIIRVSAPLAQLDRASGYEPGGRTFESCRAHQPSLVYSGHMGDGLFRAHR